MADDDNPRPDEPPLRELDLETMASKLAREIARNLIPIGEIRTRYDITESEYQKLIGSRVFSVRLAEEQEIWGASTPKAINERISAKAGVMVEEALPQVFEMIHDPQQSMAAKIQALQWASSLAGFSKREGPVKDLGDKVRFNIYIGDQKVIFDKTLDADAKLIEGAVVLNDKVPV